MEHDGRYMMDNNYRYSRTLLDACQEQATRLLYASSAAVYGGGGDVQRGARVRAAAQRLRLLEAAVRPAVRRVLPRRDARRSRAFATSTSTARASSTRAAWRRSRSIISTSSASTGKVKLFGAYGGYGAGEQRRDFVFVDDVVAVNLWFLDASRGSRASSTSAPAARSRSTTSRAAVVNASARERGDPPLASNT